VAQTAAKRSWQTGWRRIVRSVLTVEVDPTELSLKRKRLTVSMTEVEHWQLITMTGFEKAVAASNMWVF